MNRELVEAKREQINAHGTKMYHAFQTFLKEQLDGEEVFNLTLKIAIYKKNIDVLFSNIIKEFENDVMINELVDQIKTRTPKRLTNLITPKTPDLEKDLSYDLTSENATLFAKAFMQFFEKIIQSESKLHMLITISVLSSIIDNLFNELEDSAPDTMKTILREGYNMVHIKIQMVHIIANKEQFQKDFESTNT